MTIYKSFAPKKYSLDYHQKDVVKETSIKSSIARVKLNNLATQQDDKNKHRLPKDTRGIIPKDLMDIMIGYSRIVELENGGFADFTTEEMHTILSYLIKMFHLGFDEGKCSIVYANGEILTIENSNDFNKSNTQGTETSIGGTVGKDSSITGSRKWAESNSRGSGEAGKIVLGAVKYNELKSLGYDLANLYQQLIAKLDGKERTCYNDDPIWKIFNKTMYKSKIYQISNWLDFITTQIRVVFGRRYGQLAARQTNVQ